MSTTLKKLLAPILAASLISASLPAAAATSMVEDEEPGMLAMYTDLLILRPVGLATTLVGGVAYVVSLPFTAPTGGMKMAGRVLVAEPAAFTFARCLGCSRTGYYRTAEEAEEAAAEKEQESTK